MRTGLFFDLPDSPADVEVLWTSASSLAPDAVPAWAAYEPHDVYRQLSPRRVAGGSPASVPARYEEELIALQAAGLVLDGDSPSMRVYVPAPQRWAIGIYEGPAPWQLAATNGVQPVVTAGAVSDVVASFVADPFMTRLGDTWFMFFEVFNWRAGKGEIGLAESRDGLHWDYRAIVLAEDYHLSYPHVFAWQGEHYMIPETHQAGAVRLYKARRFPFDWSYVTTLVEGPYLVDASVLYDGGRWWMFVDASQDRRHGTLEIHHASDLRGPWRPHARNPVLEEKPDAARPAGRIVSTGTRLIRFAQVCRPSYGSQVVARSIDRLDEQAFEETAVTAAPMLGPSGAGWNADGMHHVDAHRVGNGRWLACVDGWSRCR